jgi:hypothetical protein
MSTVGSATSAPTAIGGSGASVQIVLPSPEAVHSMNDFQLEAAVQRVAMILYLRAHYDVPPSVIDVGGGIFNVLV